MMFSLQFVILWSDIVKASTKANFDKEEKTHGLYPVLI